MNTREAMSKFELFCMIYYTLEGYWEDARDKELAMFLSSMNPFMFQGNRSADPSVFYAFCDFMPDDITLGSSYALAEKYIAHLNLEYVTHAFYALAQDIWFEATVDFLTEWRERMARESLSE